MSDSAEPRNWTVILGFGAVLLLFTTFSLPSLIVLGVGLLPTGVAYIIDRSAQKFGSFCVGGMNLCGVFPYVLTLWTEIHTRAAATEIVSDVLTLLIMYSAAAFGWMMYLAMPPVIAGFIAVMGQTRVKKLRSIQQKILESWGTEVSSTANDLFLSHTSDGTNTGHAWSQQTIR